MRVYIRKGALALLFVLALHAPWRLMGLAAEVLVMSPGPTRVRDGGERYWDALSLEGKIASLNYSVRYQKGLSLMGVPLYGLTNTEEHSVVIEAGLSWNARYAVLAHEAGHTLQPGWSDRAQGEAFAEGVAFLVSKDGCREHARYLSSIRGEALFMLLVEWPSIYHAAAVLEDR